MSVQPLSSDTSQEMEEAYFSILRKASPGERMLMAARTTARVNLFAAAGLRERYPEAGERELFLRLAALRLDRQTMIDVYGWDPEKQGY